VLSFNYLVTNIVFLDTSVVSHSSHIIGLLLIVCETLNLDNKIHTLYIITIEIFICYLLQYRRRIRLRKSTLLSLTKFLQKLSIFTIPN
jgi:hypothetical protein